MGNSENTIARYRNDIHMSSLRDKNEIKKNSQSISKTPSRVRTGECDYSIKDDKSINNIKNIKNSKKFQDFSCTRLE